MASAARFLPSCLPEQYLAPPRYNLSSSDNLPAMKIKAMVFLLALTLPALATAQESRDRGVHSIASRCPHLPTQVRLSRDAKAGPHRHLIKTL